MNDEKKTKLIGFRVEETLYNKIKRIANEENRSFSNACIVLLKKGLQHNNAN